MSILETLSGAWRRVRGLSNPSEVPGFDTATDASAAAGPAGPAPRPMRQLPPLPRVDLQPLIYALLVASVAIGAVWVIVKFPPVQHLQPGELAVRSNQLTGSTSVWRSGSLWAWPGVHRVTVHHLGDRYWEATAMARADGPEPAQTVEGLSIGIALKLRYAIDPAQRSGAQLLGLPADLDRQVVAPAVQATVYRIVSRHTVREVFSSKRTEIEATLSREIGALLARDGVVLRSLHLGQIDLPADYRRGMEGLLTEGLEAEKMRYTLELREKQAREDALQANAEKVRREIAAEAAAREQIIAAKAQEEAMKHVLPFKQRQIEQRKLEAEAARVQRVQQAQASAEARQIESQAEADARRKLADAEAYRQASLGKVQAEQMAVEGALLTRHPLLIQKTMADRLSDKVQVIIAAPPQAGGFIGDGLLGTSGASGNAPAPGRQVTYFEAEPRVAEQ
ncbi:MAG: SPFH domain-containing protein [Hydrogenophaga sp.]|jgi:regulator of protease activity HflC (stomatin/prohibitin superfamily)|nr:SPFH domain-containing protein [Hydrogenophaga sp.]